MLHSHITYLSVLIYSVVHCCVPSRQPFHCSPHHCY